MSEQAMNPLESIKQVIQGLIDLRNPGDASLPFDQAILSVIDGYQEAYPNLVDAYIVRTKGVAYYRLGQFENALVVFKKAAELEPNNLKILKDLRDCYIKLTRPEDARDVLKKAVELDPQNIHILNILASAYLELGQFENASVVFKKAAELDPKDSEIITNLGVVYLEWGQYQEAMTVFEKAAELDPKDPYAFVGLAIASQELGRKPGTVTGYLKSAHDRATRDNTSDPSLWENILEVLEDISHSPDGVQETLRAWSNNNGGNPAGQELSAPAA